MYRDQLQLSSNFTNRALSLGVAIFVILTVGIGFFLLLVPQAAHAQTAITWSAVSAAGDNDSWRAIAYDATTTRYVAVGLGTDRVMHSTNTSAWTAVSAAGDNDAWTSITYGAGRFVAVASTTGASSDAVMTSTDGLTWATTSAVGNNDQWRALTFGNGRFVAVGSSTTQGGLNDAVMTSTDGLTWATTSAAGNNDIWNAVTYGNGKFVAVGGTGDRVMYSTDGLTWATTSATGDNDVWNSVTYGNGKFVAVGSTTAPSLEAVMISTDGITWTPVDAAANNDNWYAVTYGNGMFVAVGSSTTPSNDAVMYSIDGRSWATTSAAGNNDQWRGITFANSRFVAVGTVGDRVLVNSSPAWALSQTGFQYRNDNGSESAATNINGQNSNVTWGLNTPLRLRTQVNATLATATTPLFLQYKQTGETNWHSVGVNDPYPVIIATTTGRSSGNTTSHAITLPDGEAGDLLLVVFSHDGASTSAASSTSGWQKLGEQSNTTIVTGAVYYKFDTGNDRSFTITTVGSEESSHIVYRIRNAGVPTGAASNNSSTNSDPGNHIMPAILPHLIIATRSGDDQVRATVAPTGFGGLLNVTASTTAGATTNTAHTFTTASSSNPGTFTSAVEQWVSWTIAVPPKSSTGILQASIDSTLGSSTEVASGTIAWTNVGNGTSSDDIRASVTLSSTTASRYLLFSNYGFNIPTNATITGIEVYIEAIQTGGAAGNARDNDVRLFKAGAAVGSNLAQTARNWDTVEVVTKYGSTTNLWGTTWTPAQINANNFGVGIAVAGAAVGANRIANIDHAIMQVYYTMPAPIQLLGSSFIAAAGASTTARMITPGSDVAADFNQGRIADDTNPTPTLTIGASKYTELEWNIVATGTATTGDSYSFRTALGIDGALTRYEEVPQLTIGTNVTAGTVTVSGTAFSGVSTSTLASGVSVGLVTSGENPILYATTTSSGGNFRFTVSTTSNGSNWTARSAAGNDDAWLSTVYANGIYVAVGDSGDRAITSPDGVTWTSRSAVNNDDGWQAVTYGNGRFVAVGNSGDRVMTSLDGLTWTAVATSSAAGNNDGWQAVTYGNGRFVAVGNSGDRVMTSLDGLTWTAQSAAGNNDSWQGVTYGNGLFVVVGNGPLTDRVMTSSDGVTWTVQSAAGNDDDWFKVIFGNGLFVAVGNLGDRVMTSPDGITWTAQSAAGNDDSWNNITYGNGLFVAVSNVNDRVMTSSDGVTWTVQSAAGNNDSWYSITYGNGLFVAGSNFGDRIMTASAGFTGIGPLTVFLDASTTKATTIHTMSTTSTSTTGVPLYTGNVLVYHATTTGVSNLEQLPQYGRDFDSDVLYRGTTTATTTIYGDLITATGTTKLPAQFELNADWTQNGIIDSASGTIAFTGTDAVITGTLTGTSSLNNVAIPFAAGGQNWVSQFDPGGDNDWNAVAYGNGRYVAVAAYNGNDRIMYSDDGITWATTTAVGTRWLDVTYGNDRFVAVGTFGNRTMMSLDGITWTEYAAADNDDSWAGVTYGNGRFVAVGYGDTDEVMYSSDGITWATTTAAGDNDDWTGVTYGNGLFVAVSEYSDTPVITSPDGITWTAQSAAGNDDNWNEVVYGNGLFVAVSGYSTDKVMTSPNGVTWTVQTAPIGNGGMSGLTYGNGQFVAVGGDPGVLTSTDGITWTAVEASDNNEPWVDVTYGNGLFVAVGHSVKGNQVMTVNNKITFSSPVLMQNVSVDKNVIFGIASSTTIAGNLSNFGRIENTATITFSGVSKLLTAQATATAYAHLGNIVFSASTTIVGNSTTTDLTINSGATVVASSTYMTLTGDLNQNGSLRAASTTTFAGKVPVVTGNVTAANALNSLVVAEPVDPWTVQSLPVGATNDEWQAIAYGNGLFVAVSGWSDDNVMTSPDGITWTTRSAPGAIWNDIVFANGQFVAVGDSTTRVMTSPDGITWTTQSALGDDDNWSSITYGEGLYVAVGNGPGDYVMTSPDAVTWTVRTPAGGNNNWQQVAYGNGRFVAVAGYDGVDRVMYSDDGFTWATTTAAGNDDAWVGLEYGNGLFVATAAYNNGSDVITSPDGITWAEQVVQGNNGDLLDIVYGNGRFVAVSTYYDRIVTSTDGITWTTVAAAGNNEGWNAVAYGNGRFVAVSNNLTNNDKVITYIESDFVTTLASATAVTGNISIATTTTLLAPTSTLSVAGNFTNLGTFIPRAGTTTLSGTAKTIKGNLTNFAEATGPDYGLTNITGSYTYIGNGTTSALAINNNASLTAGSGGRLTIAHTYSNNGTFTNNGATTTLGGNLTGGATGTNALGITAIQSRSQGTEWQVIATSSALGNNDNWNDVAYGNGRFVAVGDNFSGTPDNYAGYSADGLTWTAASAPDNAWSSVAYGNGVFVAVSAYGGAPIMNSPDGITWTNQSPAGISSSWSDVTFGNGRFVAVGIFGDHRVMYSTDGVTWATSSAAGNNDEWNAVTYGDGKFVAVGNETTGDAIMYSTDGVTWATSSAPGSSIWVEVAYGNGRFVATAAFGGPVMYSFDAINWVEVTDAPDRDWNGLTYGNGYFVAAADNIMYSQDGITWATTTGSGNGVAYGNGRFVAVTCGGSGGCGTAGDRIITALPVSNFFTNASTSNLTIAASSTLNASGTIISVSSNYQNSGALIASSSTFVFNGTSAQVATGTMSASSSFTNLTLSNTSGNGTTSRSIIFGAPLTVTGTSTITASTSVAFVAGATTSIATAVWQGSVESPIYLRSTATGTPSILTITGNKNISYVNVRDSNASSTSGGITATYSTDSGNNTNWNFSNPTPVWNATDWTLFDTITIQEANIDNDLTDFPVYVNLADLSPQFWSTTPAGSSTVGTDIRVTTSDNVEVPRELVFASSTLETGELHFKAPSISSTTDTTFKIWYNGTTTGDYETSATHGRNAVWSDYTIVLHLADTSATATDSTGNTDFRYTGNTAANTGALPMGGASFDGTADQITASTSIFAGDQDPLTYQMWLNMNSIDESNFTFIGEYTGSGSASYRNQWSFSNTSDTPGFGQFGPTGGDAVASSSSLLASTDYMLHMTKGTDVVRHYKNGVIIGSPIAHTETYEDSASTVTWIGNRFETCCDASLNGDLDEVRARTTELSASWIKAEYYNQSTTTNFYTVNLVGAVGSSTIANHTSGQVNNSFTGADATNESLFAFRLTPNSGTATVTEAVIRLSGVQGFNPASTLTNLRLLRDLDSDARFDATDVAVGGTGVVTGSNQDGVITFTTDFLATTSQNYILVGDWSAPAGGSFMTVSLAASGLSMIDATSSQTVFGSVANVQHGRNNRGAGGGNSSAGGAAPAGAGNVGGGGTTGGEVIGNDPDFYRPSANSGSWNGGANAYDQTDNTYATTSASVTHSFTNSGFVIPTNNTISGIEVKLELSGTTGAGNVNVELSWNGGANWTSAKTTPTLTTNDTVRVIGSPSDLWGRSWTGSEFSNANFAVRLTGAPNSNIIRIDEIQIKVYHLTGGGGAGGGAGGGGI